jgi:protein-S-isoprenylcysteine O-methyltransferase Ste14
MVPDTAIVLTFLGWVVSWMAAAGWRKTTIARPKGGAELVHLLPTAAGVWLLFSTYASDEDPTRQVLNMRRLPYDPIQLWRTPPPVAWVLVGVALLGFLFCWWARVHLGTLWSGTVTVKPDHRVVDTGPYRLVRHPIYTGLLLAVAATAVEKGALLNVVGFGLIFIGLWIKARMEEGFLRSNLGAEAYDAYAKRTPMLVPFMPRP